MQVKRKVRFGLVLLLPIVFPMGFDFFAESVVENNSLGVDGSVSREKLLSLQTVSPINITHNDNFTSAGFSGSGTFEEPYIRRGISIEAGGIPGINITNTDAYFRIENVWISGSINTDAAGIWSENVTNGQIIRSTIINCYHGLYLQNSNFTLEYNTITLTTQYGIRIHQTFYSSISHNTITNTGSSALILDHSSYNTVENNTIQRCKDVGIFLYYYCGWNLVINNTITDIFNGNGIRAFWSGHATNITYNTIANTGGDGVEIDWHTGASNITNNRITNTTEYGIHIINECHDDIVTGNTIANTKKQGILITNCDRANITRNIIFNSTSYGIDIWTLSDNTHVSWNAFLNNNNSGTQASDNGTGNTFTHNYWNDWTSPDENGDGIVDSAYLLDGGANNADAFPLTLAPILNLTAITVASNDGPDGFEAAGFSGNGTLNNPYCLNNISNELLEISISDTTAYFLIGNLTINSGSNPAVGGIKLKNVTNGQLFNVTVKNSYYGISLEAASNLVLIDNYAVNNTQDGFSLSLDSNNNALINNTAILNHGNGFHVANSSSDTFSGNGAEWNNQHGFYLGATHNSTLTNNFATENTESGFKLALNCKNSTLANNTAITNGQNGFCIVDGSNITLSGNNAEWNNQHGFYLGATHNSTLTNNYANGSTGSGFKLALNSKNSTLINNTAATNGQNGFHVADGCNITLSGNGAEWNNQHGFHLENSTSLNLTRNVANDNSEEGFLLQTSSKFILLNNTAQNNIIGVFLEEASNNTLTGNSILNNTGYGIFLSFSSGNLVYLNFFIMNNQGGMSQGFDDSEGNSWTNSTHGNFWSDYDGEDTDGDGIGDTANYSVGVGIDFRPLVLDSLIPFSSLHVTGPANVIIEAGSMDIYSIIWLPTTNFFPTGYTIYKNGEEINSGSWTSGKTIRLDVNVINFPLNALDNFTLVISDHSGKVFIHSVWVTVKDTAAPDLLFVGPTEMTFERGSANNTLDFTLIMTDMFLDNFTLYQDDIVIFSWEWPPQTPERIITEGAVTLVFADSSDNNLVTVWASITVNLDYLQGGSYNFTLVVLDTSNNAASVSIIVTVTGSSDSDGNGEAISGFLMPIVFLSLIFVSRIHFGQGRKKKRRKSKNEAIYSLR